MGEIVIPSGVRRPFFARPGKEFERNLEGGKRQLQFTKIGPTWSPNGAQMGPKWSPNRPRDVPREVPKTRSQKKTSRAGKNGHVGAHGRILSKLGAALGAILEKVDFEGGPKIVIFEAKST